MNPFYVCEDPEYSDEHIELQPVDDYDIEALGVLVDNDDT